MYRYNAFDERFVQERVVQYRDQVERRLSGALTEDEFKPLRLMNGVYLQLHETLIKGVIPIHQARLAKLTSGPHAGWLCFGTTENTVVV